MSLGIIQDATEGENKEFGVATISDVTIHINDSSKTSADDTATDKYLDNQLTESSTAMCGSGTAFFLRADQTIQIVGINKITFTDPITVVIDKGHREEFNVRILEQIIIRTTVVNTNIKIRVK